MHLRIRCTHLFDGPITLLVDCRRRWRTVSYWQGGEDGVTDGALPLSIDPLKTGASTMYRLTFTYYGGFLLLHVENL